MDRPTDRPAYRERLWPGPVGWAAVLGFAGFALIALLPARASVAMAAAVVALLAGTVTAVLTSPVVAVGDGELRAGRAHIPVGLLGRARTLDRAGVRAALGPGSDARTYACLRAGLGAVELEVTDPADPTPTWLVSTRRPAALLAAVEAARGRPQAAHSEQIG